MRSDWPVDVDPIFGCWNWRGDVGANGYAIVFRGSGPITAKRVVYEHELGAIPDDLVLDHLCRRRLCVAPHHMEPMTKGQNEQAKLWRVRVRKTKCTRGHNLKLSAIVTPEGGRICRECNREAS